MTKTLLFFRLRMRQLKSDKTALFFCYVLPVLLLVGIGYPLHTSGPSKITLYYSDHANNSESRAFVEYLHTLPLVDLQPASLIEGDAVNEVSRNEIPHFIDIGLASSATGLAYHLYGNAVDSSRIENTALRALVEDYFEEDKTLPVEVTELAGQNQQSYVVTLLPGLIGMTFLVIGLNGFGGVIIEEEKRGLFRNLKTIDASPIPFLAGLFLSRLFIASTVALVMYLLGVFVFGLPHDINFLLLGLIVLLASTAFLGVGLVIAVVSPSVDAFNGIVNMVQLAFIILGGVFSSIATFPEWLQVIAQSIPMIHVNNGLRSVLFEGAGFNAMPELSIELAVVLAWALATFAIGWRRFRW